MESYFLDTNVFLRYLTNDDPAKADRIERLFRQAEKRKATLITSHLVIAELVWTLESYYHLSPPVIEETLLKIINTPFIEVPQEGLIIQALDLYVTQNIDFIDAYIDAHIIGRGVERTGRFNIRAIEPGPFSLIGRDIAERVGDCVRHGVEGGIQKGCRAETGDGVIRGFDVIAKLAAARLPGHRQSCG